MEKCSSTNKNAAALLNLAVRKKQRAPVEKVKVFSAERIGQSEDNRTEQNPDLRQHAGSEESPFSIIVFR